LQCNYSIIYGTPRFFFFFLGMEPLGCFTKLGLPTLPSKTSQAMVTGERDIVHGTLNRRKESL